MPAGTCCSLGLSSRPRIARRAQNYSALASGYDLVMAMDPHWYSTLFVAYSFVKVFSVGLVAIIIAAVVAVLAIAFGFLNPWFWLGLMFVPIAYGFLRRRTLRRMQVMALPFPDEWDQILQSHVEFYRALGGGWDPDTARPPERPAEG